MKTGIILFFIALITTQIGFAQSDKKAGSMNIMTTVVSSNSANSVPLMISIPGDHNQSELKLSPSNENSAEMIISGSPYSTVYLQIPSDTTATNQYRETAAITDFQLIYGNSPEQSEMEVVSPGSCNEFMIPETGQLYIRIGGTITSESELRGVFTGAVDFECTPE